jgi:hypothetical protein
MNNNKKRYGVIHVLNGILDTDEETEITEW